LVVIVGQGRLERMCRLAFDLLHGSHSFPLVTTGIDWGREIEDVTVFIVFIAQVHLIREVLLLLRVDEEGLGVCGRGGFGG
jgi:hypothetical protein